jgi:hypothetical protein
MFTKFIKIHEAEMAYIARVNPETFKCPSDEALANWYNSLDDDGKRMATTMSQLGGDGYQIPTKFVESKDPLLTH